jgi:hypothetical protein
MQYIVNTQIANIAAMQQQTEMFTRHINPQLEILWKAVLQSFALSAKDEKTAKDVCKRKGKEVQRPISANDVEWQGQFEELAEQVAKLSKARCLDAKGIAEVKTWTASHPSHILPVREKDAEAAPPALPPSPPTGGRRVRDPSPSSPPGNNEERKDTAPLLDVGGTTPQSTLRMTGQS